MSDIVIAISAHGLGDCLCGITCASYVYKKNKYSHIYLSTRDEIAQPLEYLFKDQHKFSRLPEHWLSEALNNDKMFENLKSHPEQEIFFEIPDVLFRHNRSFKYKDYNTNPQMIRGTKLLTHKYNPDYGAKIVYVNLSSSTPGYVYSDVGSLLRSLGKNLPDYNFFVPIITKWNNIDIKYDDLDNMPPNINIQLNPNFIDCIDVMYKSIFAIVTDGGPMHLFHHIGTPKLVLDPQYGKTPWVARWKTAFTTDCIDIGCSIKDITNVTKTLLEIPETQLLPRLTVLNMTWGKSKNFSEKMIFKY